jgi:hypothetical protein
MTSKRVSAVGPRALRRNVIWPWLVMPMAILALFAVLHSVRRSGAAGDQDSNFGVEIP